MKKIARCFSTITLILALTAFCASVVCAAGSTEEAKQILEKTAKKYDDLLKKDGKEIKSVVAKISIVGGGQLPMDDAGGMPLDVNLGLELYFKRPYNLYLELAGNLGNIKLVVTGEEKKTATVILPTTNQFAIIDVPEEIAEKIQTNDVESEEPGKIEELWEKAEIIYQGTEKLKAGKAHKITLKSKNPADKEMATVFILDKKWDPVRIEISDGEEGKVTINIEKLELNAKVPDKQFVPNTTGYAEVSQDQLVTVLMMQVMGAMMQGGAMQ